MRVIVASKFLYPRGGLERVMFDEIEALEAAGHEVVHFSTTHPDNIDSAWKDHFAPYIEIGAGINLDLADKIRAVFRMFHNRGAAQLMGQLIDAVQPDLVHAHGIHRQLSPSILLAAAHKGVPVVHTLHDYHLVCPADVMLRGGATPCLPRSCGNRNYGAAVRNRCTRGSLAASTISAAELTFQRMTRSYERSVTRFVSPSRFVRDVMLAGGWDRTPIDVVPLGVRAVPEQSARGEYFLFAGRLSPEKGVDVLLGAAAKAGVTVVVAGDGPTRGELAAAYPDVRFTGHVNRDEVAELLRGARAAVVPSVSLENSPLGVLEAMAAGVPVVASAVGGVPELLNDGVEGLLVPPRDTDALAQALSRLASDQELATTMGRAGHERASRDFTPDKHSYALIETYLRAMEAVE